MSKAAGTSPPVKMRTAAEVAEMTRLSPATIWKLIASGELESVKIGWARRIPEDAVDAYIDSLRADKAAGQGAA